MPGSQDIRLCLYFFTHPDDPVVGFIQRVVVSNSPGSD